MSPLNTVQCPECHQDVPIHPSAINGHIISHWGVPMEHLVERLKNPDALKRALVLKESLKGVTE